MAGHCAVICISQAITLPDSQVCPTPGQWFKHLFIHESIWPCIHIRTLCAKHLSRTRDTITNTHGSLLLKLCEKRQIKIAHQPMTPLPNSAERYGVNSIVRMYCCMRACFIGWPMSAFPRPDREINFGWANLETAVWAKEKLEKALEQKVVEALEGHWVSLQEPEVVLCSESLWGYGHDLDLLGMLVVILWPLVNMNPLIYVHVPIPGRVSISSDWPVGREIKGQPLFQLWKVPKIFMLASDLPAHWPRSTRTLSWTHLCLLNLLFSIICPGFVSRINLIKPLTFHL